MHISLQQQVSKLNASNNNIDKQQLIKHVLIILLSFLVYESFKNTLYSNAFDQQQTKLYTTLLNQCDIDKSSSMVKCGTRTAFKTISDSTNQDAKLYSKLIRSKQDINSVTKTALRLLRQLHTTKRNTAKNYTKATTAYKSIA
jgi:hypothetical protein